MRFCYIKPGIKLCTPGCPAVLAWLHLQVQSKHVQTHMVLFFHKDETTMHLSHDMHIMLHSLREPLLIHCQSELLTIAHADYWGWSMTSLQSRHVIANAILRLTDRVQDCGLGTKQVVILHEWLQRCKLWSVITQCWSWPTITDYHGQIWTTLHAIWCLMHRHLQLVLQTPWPLLLGVSYLPSPSTFSPPLLSWSLSGISLNL